MKKIVFFGLFCLISLVTFGQAADYYLYVGTYTRKTSEGIYVFRFNTKTGDFAPVGVAKGSNPSFLSISADRRFLYSVGGSTGDTARAFAIDKASHQLTLLNAQPTGGKGGTHLEVDKTGKWVIVGNYTSGNLSVLPVAADGSLGKLKEVIQHEGKSIDPERQTKPYVHSINIAPNNKDVFVPDLGTDKIMTYSLNAQTGQLTPGNPPFTTETPGAGPRHFTYHPNGKFAYVIHEMGGTITGFTYKNGALMPFQTISTLPDDYAGRKWCADIHISPDGKFLYGSNRAHESLAIYSINPKTGQLTLVGYQNVLGKTPRNFAIDPTGTFVLVANQDTDNITIFKRDATTGKLTPTGKEITVSMPVCLKFIP
ncbi:lactonase family protein [Larkinella terrae]|uniref:Beta-propeller fold lactonase family protein n=1 Tax=Larkinella terrae TaxID=2025311 RepID=A0A7K0ES96_9BACT|nr:lactonase family protein [Larkinella terrae]MRS64649.1 beta-propeller fold lactonase family protein [Larkinella terrae]